MTWTERETPDGVGIGEGKGQQKKAGGLLVEIHYKVGKHSSTVYDLVQQDGEILRVWGSTVIDGKLNPSDVGKFVKLEYLSTITGKAGADYKDIRVSVWDAELTDVMQEWPRVEEFYTAKEGVAAMDGEEEGDGLPF